MFCRGKRLRFGRSTRYALVLFGILIGTAMAPPHGPALTITQMVPSPEQQSVSRSVDVKAYLSEPVRPESVHMFSVYLLGKERRLPGKIQYVPEERCVVFTPLKPLSEGTVYTVVLTREIASGDGGSLRGTRQWEFRTAGTPAGDAGNLATEGIDLLWSQPADGEQSTDFPGRVEMRFNKPLLADSLSLFTVRLSDGTNYVMGTIEEGTTPGAFSFVPNNPLPGGTHYTLIIGPGLFTKDGEYLDREIRISFSLAEDDSGRTTPGEKAPAPVKPASPAAAVPAEGERNLQPPDRHPTRFTVDRRWNELLNRPASPLSGSNGSSDVPQQADQVLDAEQRDRLRRIRGLINTLEFQEK